MDVLDLSPLELPRKRRREYQLLYIHIELVLVVTHGEAGMADRLELSPQLCVKLLSSSAKEVEQGFSTQTEAMLGSGPNTSRATCMGLSESSFSAIQEGMCVCHGRPVGLHAHVPLVVVAEPYHRL